MFERDFLMRAIHELADALGRIMQARREQHFEQAFSEINDACTRLVGMGPEDLAALPVANILNILRGNASGALNPAQALGVARLLKELGATHEAAGRPDAARKVFLKSFALYDELTNEVDDAALHEHEKTISWLMQRLGAA